MKFEANKIQTWLLDGFTDVHCKKTYGEQTFFYNKDQKLPNGVYFLTIKDADGPNDRASRLDRDGIYRVSWQLAKDRFIEKFKTIPTRPLKGEHIETTFDLAETNIHMPHAIYGWMCWTMILSPSQKIFESLKPTIDEAYERAKRRFEKKLEKLK